MLSAKQDAPGRVGRVWEGELINRRKDGTHYVELTHIAPIQQPDGTVTHYLAIKTDVSDKKRLEKQLTDYREHLEEMVARRTAELAQSEARTRAIVRSLRDGVVHIDATGRILSLNEAVAELPRKSIRITCMRL